MENTVSTTRCEMRFPGNRQCTLPANHLGSHASSYGELDAQTAYEVWLSAVESAKDSVRRGGWSNGWHYAQCFKPYLQSYFAHAYETAFKELAERGILTQEQKAFRRAARKLGEAARFHISEALHPMTAGCFEPELHRATVYAREAAQHAFAAHPELRIAA
jgi:hypothetical protein